MKLPGWTNTVLFGHRSITHCILHWVVPMNEEKGGQPDGRFATPDLSSALDLSTEY